MKINFVLTILFIVSCSESKQNEITQQSNLQMILREVIIECNNGYVIGKDTIPYFPYQIYFAIVIKNNSNDTLMFGSNNRFGQDEVIKKYGIFILHNSRDILIFNSRLDQITLAKNDSIEVKVDYNNDSYFNKLPHFEFSKHLYEIITRSKIYFEPINNDFMSHSSNWKLPRKTLIEIPKDLKIYFVTNGKYISVYPEQKIN